jgi:hypothetical protein
VLNLRAIQCGANISANRAGAIFTLDAVKSDLDQFVGLEATVDLGQDGRCQAFLADGDDGIQVVRGGAEGAALGGGNFYHGGIVA